MKMFMMIGERRTSASGTNRPVTNIKPETSSVIFRSGKKYPLAARPSLNDLTAPSIGGGVIKPKKKVTEANKKSSPISVRTMIIAIFIVIPFSIFQLHTRQDDQDIDSSRMNALRSMELSRTDLARA